MFNHKLLLIALASSLALISSVNFATAAEIKSGSASKLYKWVDKNGTTHYSETIPPEYADRDSQTLGSQGRIKQRTEKFDPELQRTTQEAAERKKAEDAAAAEQKRRDETLLNTYSSEKEIDEALKRNLQLLDARVSSFTTMVKSAQDTVDSHRKEVDERKKAGKQPPQSLLDDIAASESRVERLKKDLAQSEQEVITVKARFEKDKADYRKLRGAGK